MKTNYMFLKEMYSEGEETFYAISPDKIVEMPVSNVRDQYGQKIGSDNAGDSIELVSQKAAEIASGEHNFEVGDLVLAYENGNAFESIRSSLELEEGKDYILNQQMAKGFDYWDGHNWRTVVVEMPDSDSAYEIVTDEKLIIELLKSIDEKEFVRDGFGKKIYQGNSYVVIDNYCEGSWDTYRLIAEAEL